MGSEMCIRDSITGLNAEAMDLFMRYRWPGNVRELKGALEYAFVVAEAGLIRPEHLPSKLTAAVAEPSGVTSPPPPPQSLAEKEALVTALMRCGGNQTQAARLLGVNRVTVWHRIRKYGIDPKRLAGNLGARRKPGIPGESGESGGESGP